MKRNKQSSRAMRQRLTTNSRGNKSRYARKKASGRQMYGPGCCGHKYKLKSEVTLCPQ